MEVDNDEKWKQFRNIVTKCVEAHHDPDIDEIIALEMGDLVLNDYTVCRPLI